MKGQAVTAFCILSIVISCTANYSVEHYESGVTPLLQPGGKTLAARILPPPGARRTPAGAADISTFFRALLLKPAGAPVLYYDGREKANPGIYAAVLSMDVGTADLQQCADAVMRLRAEWLWSIGQHSRIHFNFTSGFRAGWDKWRQGYRIVISANRAAWLRKSAPAADYAVLRSYLTTVFTYAGTLSLATELKPVSMESMAVGDVFIQGGSPGHAVTVMDMATDSSGKKFYLLSQSYMPAQDIQILHNPENAGISPWYELRITPTVIHTPQWDFTTADLKRFVD